MTDFIPGDGPHFRPPTLGEFNFRIDSKVGYIDTNASAVQSTVDDVTANTITAESSDPYYDLEIIGVGVPVELVLLDATGSFSGNRVNRASDGACRVLARHPWLSRTVTLDMSRIGGNVYTELVSYASGSLARHMMDDMLALVGTHTAAQMPLYAVANHATATYVRNPDCWLSGVDLTAISPWNSRGSYRRGGTVISPRHTLQATHYPLAGGDTIRFVTADNTVVTRTIADTLNLSQPVAYSRDVQIALLDEDLPESITPLKFLPANVADYVPSWYSFPIPLIGTNQTAMASCLQSRMFAWDPLVDRIGSGRFASPPYATEYTAELITPIITHDSGQPVMAVIDGAAVLVNHQTFAGLGTAHHLMLTEIAAALATLGGGHTLSTVDLSSFTNYGA